MLTDLAKYIIVGVYLVVMIVICGLKFFGKIN